jgi:hypothetical protein
VADLVVFFRFLCPSRRAEKRFCNFVNFGDYGNFGNVSSAAETNRAPSHSNAFGAVDHAAAMA